MDTEVIDTVTTSISICGDGNTPNILVSPKVGIQYLSALPVMLALRVLISDLAN